MRMKNTVTLLLAVSAFKLVEAQLYSVTKEPLPDCDTRMSVETTPLMVNRGVVGAPCTGILNYKLDQNSRRICGDVQDFNKAAAQRLCWTLGLDVHREVRHTSGIRLYSCDIYVEENAIFPKDTSNQIVHEVEIQNLYGQRCNQDIDISNTKCFDRCYFGEVGVDSDPPLEASVLNCVEQFEPFWAITCNDINECLTGVLADCQGPFDDSCTQRKACGGNTTCDNIVGSYKCQCQNGYEPASGDEIRDPYLLDVGCIDIDECHQDELVCGMTGQCQNTLGSYICLCPINKLWNDTTKTCEGSLCGVPIPDQNAERPVFTVSPIESAFYECKDGYMSPTGTGSYTNMCNDGVWEDNGYCTDVDECNPSQCNPNAMCTNFEGGFICQCNVGYAGDGKTCKKTDPCDTMENFGMCQNGVCTVVNDMAECSCDPGFEGFACERRQLDTSLMVASAALALIILLTLALLLCACFRTMARPSPTLPVFKNPAPVYQDPSRVLPPPPRFPPFGRFAPMIRKPPIF